MNARRSPSERPGIALAEEALHLVRAGGLPALAVYYIGSMPFVLALLVHWAVMLQVPGAGRYLPWLALLLAPLFVWMKAWQSRYCRLLYARALDQAPEPWGLRAFLRTCSVQAPVQASGWLLMPFSLLLLLPLPWTHAFYQNATVLDDGNYHRARDLVRDSSRLAALWPRQNLLVMWILSPLLLFIACVVFYGLQPLLSLLELPVLGLVFAFYSGVLFLLLLPLSPFGVVLAINIGAGGLFLAQLLSMLFGIETIFTVVPDTAESPTYGAIICGLSYLVIDPVLKSAYVLRCFHGRSRQSGEDLLITLRQARAAVVALLLFAFTLALPAAGQERVSPGIAPQRLDARLDQELEKPRYNWREFEGVNLDRQGAVLAFLETVAEYIDGAVKTIKGWVKDFFDWLLDRDLGAGGDVGRNASLHFGDYMRVLLIGLICVLLALVVVYGLRAWRGRAVAVSALPEAAAPPDIEDERTTADKLPEEGWLALAQEYLARGELRLAVRCLFLATLARLAQQHLITIGFAKTNQDYRRELQRRAHAQPNLVPAFTHGLRLYEEVWYGEHAAHEATIEELRHTRDALAPPAPPAGPGHTL